MRRGLTGVQAGLRRGATGAPQTKGAPMMGPTKRRALLATFLLAGVIAPTTGATPTTRAPVLRATTCSIGTPSPAPRRGPVVLRR